MTRKTFSAALLTFSKAFDSVWRVGLWRKLLSTHVDGKFLRVLQNMYSNIKSYITVAGEDSPFSSVIGE